METYQNPVLPADVRARDLLERMTVHEKVGQLKSNDGNVKAFLRDGESITVTQELIRDIQEHQIGFLICVTRFDAWGGVDAEKALTPRMCAEIINRIQEVNLSCSRLKIPILHGNPATHGHMSVGSTVFPTGLGMGTTWDPELVRRVNQIIARESRAQGSYMGDPVIIDVNKDPRWGRTEENWGEDPYLAGKMAAAGIRGLQNENQFGDEAIVSLMKHFAAHGTSQGGHNRAPASLPERELIEQCLWPWREAVQAGGRAVMPSYNEINGVQNHASRALLTKLLKEEWGFQGYVIADENAIMQMVTRQHVAESPSDAQKRAFLAGVDVDITNGSEPYSELEQLVEQGVIPMDRLDDAVLRVLRVKFELGLFEEPYTPLEKSICVGCGEHRAVSLEAAREAIVLLENKENLLPFDESIRQIAVIGPNADNLLSQIGDYAAIQKEKHIITPLRGIQEMAKKHGVGVTYARGCGVLDGTQEEIDRGAETVEEADVAVVVLGTNSWKEWRDSYPKETNCGEGFDVSDLGLPEIQKKLLQAAKAKGKPIVVVLINGRPVSDPWMTEQADAVLNAGYPGCEGGRAIAEILFGETVPSGKLTMTVPRHAGQLPVYYNRRMESMQSYCDENEGPLYPFGYGLSYTTFEYGQPALERDSILLNEETFVSVQVTNTGKRDADEIVQLYIHDEVSSVTRPVQELKGFERVFIPAGETRNVRFKIGREQLHMLNEEMREVVEPGWFTLLTGPDSVRLSSVRLEVKEDRLS